MTHTYIIGISALEIQTLLEECSSISFKTRTNKMWTGHKKQIHVKFPLDSNKILLRSIEERRLFRLIHL